MVGSLGVPKYFNAHACYFNYMNILSRNQDGHASLYQTVAGDVTAVEQISVRYYWCRRLLKQASKKVEFKKKTREVV